MALLKQNGFQCTKHQLGAAHTTSTVFASLWMNSMEIAVDINLHFYPYKETRNSLILKLMLSLKLNRACTDAGLQI